MSTGRGRASAAQRGARRAADRPASPLSPEYRLTTFGIVSLVTLIAFESMAVSTAMPVVAAALDAVREYGFAFSVFLTAFLLGVVVSGGWGDARGPAAPTRAGLVLFGGGLVVCGAARSLPVLLAGRAVAGVGGGMLVVAMYVVIAQAFPSALQPRVFALISTAWVLPSIVGPAVAGWLAQSVSWRLVFLLVPPLTVPPALALLPRLPAAGPPRTPADHRLDRSRIAAGVVLAVGVGALQWGLGDGGPVGTAVGIAGAVTVLAALPRLLPAGTLRLARGLPSVIAVRGLYAGAYFGVEAFVPLMLVSQRHLSPAQAGIALTGGALGWTGGSWVQGRPGLRVPRHLLLLIGGLVVGAGECLLVLSIRPPAPAWLAVPIWALTAFGIGLAMSSTSVLSLRLSPPGAEGRTGSALQVSDSLGSALGIGLAGAVFAAGHDPGGHDAGLFTGMWLVLGALACLAGWAGLRARGDAATVAH